MTPKPPKRPGDRRIAERRTLERANVKIAKVDGEPQPVFLYQRGIGNAVQLTTNTRQTRLRNRRTGPVDRRSQERRKTYVVFVVPGSRSPIPKTPILFEGIEIPPERKTSYILEGWEAQLLIKNGICTLKGYLTEHTPGKIVYPYSSGKIIPTTGIYAHVAVKE